MTLAQCLTSIALLGVLGGAATHAAPRVDDSMSQRMQACTGCHGREGRAAPDGYYPRIAGKPAGYLYNQLAHFREGRRHYLPMVRLLDPLSDAYLHEIAQYFASLDLPYPPAQPPQAPAEVLARGEALARRGDAQRGLPACVQCHGTALTGVRPAIPGLLGLPRDYLAAQLGAWQTGSRRAHSPDCMARIAKVLTADEVSAVSHWLAAQPLPADTKPVAVLAAPMPLDCGGLDAR